jgi:AraC-like DNA-binding protein
MPIYLDRHDAPDEVTAEHVAEMHQADLKHQDKFGCRGFTYWFDDDKKMGFCLIEAPNKEAIIAMHKYAHGDIPTEIIEVEKHFIESFLGRIDDPKKAENSDLNIINDPAFRTLMVIGLKRNSFAKLIRNQNGITIKDITKSIDQYVKQFEGRLVKHLSDCFLLSFVSTSNAILCALKIQSEFKKLIKGNLDSGLKLKIGLSCGIPVTEKENIFEGTINTAEMLCDISRGKIIISSEVKELFESENQNIFIDKKLINALNPSEENFLNLFISIVEKTWRNTNLKVDDFGKNLGLSKSQLYRNLKSATGKSPNTYIKDYRLNKALTLLNNQESNISEIAYQTGFNSPAYFSKCFREKFGILPSSYANQKKESLYQ